MIHTVGNLLYPGEENCEKICLGLFVTRFAFIFAWWVAKCNPRYSCYRLVRTVPQISYVVLATLHDNYMRI